MIYVPAWPAFVMNRLPPSMTHVPPSGPSSSRAVVRVPPASEPAPGSVSPYAADDRPAGHRNEEPLLLLVRAGEVERAAAERRVGSDDQPERAPDPADLLDRDRIGERVEAGAALVLGNGDPEPAHLAEVADDLDREAPLALVLLDDRRHLLKHVVADRVAEERVLRGEVEVHRTEPSTRGSAATSRRDAPPVGREAEAGKHRPGRFLLASPHVGDRPERRPGARRPRRRLGLRSRARQGERRSGPVAVDAPAGDPGQSPPAWTVVAGRAGDPSRRQPDRRPPAAPRARAAPASSPAQAERHGVGRPRHLYDVTPDAQDLFPADYDGLRHRRSSPRSPRSAARTPRGGLRRPSPAARRRAFGRGWPRGCRPERHWPTGSASWRSSRTSRATSPRRDRGRRHDPAARAQLRDLPAGQRASARPARPSSSCSATSSAPRSIARRISPRATAAAPTGSAKRRRRQQPD